MKTFFKDPDAVLDYNVDWEDWLGSDTIASVSHTVPTGLTLDSETYTNTVATAIISGGTAGTRYEITCQITTAGGLTDDRSYYIRVREK
jgi:hypothetical protein